MHVNIRDESTELVTGFEPEITFPNICNESIELVFISSVDSLHKLGKVISGSNLHYRLR